ncbi:ECF transporter S component [Weissella soli]|uniref:Putative membrane protein n=1 Tax=Weissella soli TaxID=155866 RepID=A0A288Q626_9LACO|nr:ECF transporter S component [Weissella soli]AOT56207.1 Thiamine precursor transporter HmpT [Weissella soli]NKY82666.1 ECF transporter S component [Weissella soli]RDL11781.1 putative membrane protein [Weissella soli]GEN92992.1 hypothetical protein WSO01_06040 [Weissella soli]
MKKTLTTRNIAILAVLIGVNIVLNFFLRIPTATGFISLVEAGIVIAAWNFGATGGLIVGGLTGFLLDLMSGYPQWMFISLIIHGAEGAVFGYLGREKSSLSRLISIIAGGAVMVTGYFLGGILLQVLNHASFQTAVYASTVDILGNVLQVLAGALLAGLIIEPVSQRLLADGV